MLYLLSLSLAVGSSPGPDVTVAFSPDGGRALVQSRSTGEGSGLPMVELTEMDTRSGLTLGSWTSAPDSQDQAAADASAWAAARAAKGLADIDVAKSALAIPCERGECVVSGGCSSRTVVVAVSALPFAPMPEECLEFARPETPMVTVDGKLWPVAAPAAACAHGYNADSLYLSGSHAVVIVRYTARGHEGGRGGVLALAGSAR